MSEIYEDEMVLCAASSYNELYYFNEMFDNLPDNIKRELQIICVLFTADVGGIIQLAYDEEGALQIITQSSEDDILYDDIGAALKVKQIQREHQDLFESLETFYKVFVLNEEV